MISKAASKRNSLGSLESQCEVVAPLFGVQFTEIESFWVVVVKKGAKRQSVVPAGREIGHVHILKRERECSFVSVDGNESSFVVTG